MVQPTTALTSTHYYLQRSYLDILIGSIAITFSGRCEMITAALLVTILNVVLDAGPIANKDETQFDNLSFAYRREKGVISIYG